MRPGQCIVFQALLPPVAPFAVRNLPLCPGSPELPAAAQSRGEKLTQGMPELARPALGTGEPCQFEIPAGHIPTDFDTGCDFVADGNAIPAGKAAAFMAAQGGNPGGMPATLWAPPRGEMAGLRRATAARAKAKSAANVIFLSIYQAAPAAAAHRA